MEYKLTSKLQFSHHDSDGVDRNYVLFFLNDILILKQKLSYDTELPHKCDCKVGIKDVYIQNGKLHQKRCRCYRRFNPRFNPDNKYKFRDVYYPLSKKNNEAI